MKILVGFECSGKVRDAFIEKGHDAISCDIVPSDRPGPHILGDIREIKDLSSFDMALFFPPCTRLCRSGLRWIAERNLWKEQVDAINMFLWCTETPIEKWCIENPVGIMSTMYRKPNQYIQPWEHGHKETKKTCLWLKGLPLLVPSNTVNPTNDTIHNHIAPGPERSKIRSETYSGIATAFANQWG